MGSRTRRDVAGFVVPELTGRTVLVTGANGGIGFWTALRLGRAGARVVLGCRSAARAEAAVAQLREAVPGGHFEVLILDLADLGSVRRAADTFRTTYDRLDVLVNNAGVALVPRARTADGFEAHLGTNFLGHFALTGLLIDQMRATPGSRVVHVGSIAHRFGRLRFEDLGFEHGRRYVPWNAYSQSKLANVLFLHELQRRLEQAGSPTISVGAHPGASFTGIAERLWIVRVPGIRPTARWLEGKALNTPELGAEPSVRAASEPGLPGASYFGPSGLFEVKGMTVPAKVAKRALDRADAARLWAVASDLTGVSFLE